MQHTVSAVTHKENLERDDDAGQTSIFSHYWIVPSKHLSVQSHQ